MNESLRAEIRQISRLGDHDWAGTGKVETTDENVVDPFERDGLDPAVPSDLRYEIHN